MIDPHAIIDSSAIIDPSAIIAADVYIGPYTIIGPHVEIGSGTHIGAHTVVKNYTKIGCHNYIDSFVSLGGDPQYIHYKNEITYLEIGNYNIIREFCSVNRGTHQGGGITRLGDRNFLMAYVHIAHDCILGNEIVLANNTNLAGHVEIADYVMFSAFCGVHQFVTIGSHSFLGRSTKVVQDIPPYVLVIGNPGTPCGLNLVGLKRRGFSQKTLLTLRQAYSLVYRKNLRLQEAIDQLLLLSENCVELISFIQALRRSKRGLAR